MTEDLGISQRPLSVCKAGLDEECDVCWGPRIGFAGFGCRKGAPEQRDSGVKTEDEGHSDTSDHVQALSASGMSQRQIANKLGISKTTVARLLK
jgi:hypothetical protein